MRSSQKDNRAAWRKEPSSLSILSLVKEPTRFNSSTGLTIPRPVVIATNPPFGSVGINSNRESLVFSDDCASAPRTKKTPAVMSQTPQKLACIHRGVIPHSFRSKPNSNCLRSIARPSRSGRCHRYAARFFSLPSMTSRFIGEALADDAQQRAIGAFQIFASEL